MDHSLAVLRIPGVSTNPGDLHFVVEASPVEIRVRKSSADILLTTTLAVSD
jgi:hypothetical protein